TAMTPVLIDTDPGIDDAMAILYALADPALDVLGLTSVFGNVDVATATANAQRLVELAGAAVPVAAGAGVPLVQPPPPHADYVHGADGFGGAVLPEPAHPPDPRPAWQFIAETCAARPREITLIALGPLTNLALALDQRPGLVDDVAQVIVMGGAVRTRGNVNAHAEANIWQDPHAAARVLEAGWPVRLVGLDVTERVRLLPEALAPMAATSPRAGGFLTEAAAFYFDFHRRTDGFYGCFLHDPAAVIAALAPELFARERLGLAVVSEGPAAGQTTEDAEAAPTEVCLGVEVEAVLARFLSVLEAGRLP
ncbi:MAG: nucleoside hydrolase, partial [Pseudomonadota bacterium]